MIEYNKYTLMLFAVVKQVLCKEEIDVTDQYIYDLACLFKAAMLAAKADGYFNRDICFREFPRGCCGDTCYLLASFLKEKDIETLYVWGDRGFQSHAWLVVNDNRVRQSSTRYIKLEHEYIELLNRYGGESGGTIEDSRYRARDLTNGLIIDITADQFGEPSVYVGKRNDFYRKFTFRDAHICYGVHNSKLGDLYERITLYLSTLEI